MSPRPGLGLLAAGGLCALLAGCGTGVEGKGEETLAGAADTPAYGDTFIEASIGDIAGLIPNITTDGASHDVGNMMYDGLVRADKDLKYVPQMAESWTFSPDCLTLTFKLRRDIRWHDGRPFTADDVLFTYEAMINPRTPTAYKEDFLAVKRAEVPDPYTFRVTYAQPLAKALQSWGTWVLPRHRLEGYVADGKLRESPQNSRPVGTGPYRFQEWKSGEKVVLVANPDYYQGRPYLSRVVYRIIPSQGTIFLELKAKGVDLAGLTAIQYARQTEYPAFRKAYRKYRYPSSAYTYFGFNLKDPRFADRRVRQAFAHAINKQELIDGVIMGFAREATGPLRPGTWAYTDKVKRYPYDPERAKALLAEAGWKDRDGDGVVEDKDGKPFAFTIRTNQGNEERKKVAEIIQQRLKEIGVSAEIQVIEWASFIKEFIKKKRFETIVLGWGVGTDPDQYGVWHSSQTGPDQLNHISYANPEVDALLDRGRASCHQAERVASYHRFQGVLAEDQPIIFLYFRDALPVVSSRVRGIVPGPAGIFYNFTEWYVPKELQRYTSG
jgi:peptide/nickel transport system substrate-binding protein